MTPKKQVSPAIRILRGERDASARATHLEAATRKFLVTTNERKQMSTKTNFKRIALVAVAALGLGVLSSVPSQATISGVTVTTENGTAAMGGNYDSSTAATVSVTALLDNKATDSITVTYFAKSRPTDAAVNLGHLRYIDSTTGATASSTVVDTSVTTTAVKSASDLSQKLESVTVTNTDLGGNTFRIAADTNGFVGATFRMELDSATLTAGTYTYTIVVKTFTAGGQLLPLPATTNSYDVSIVVSALANVSATATATYGFAYISGTTTASPPTATAADEVLTKLATAGTTRAYLYVGVRNAANGATTAEESLTATVTGVGLVCTTTTNCGKSLGPIAQTGDREFLLQGDGSGGVSTIKVTGSVTGASYTKTITYYAAAAKTLTASVLTPVLKIGSNDSALSVVAVDAAGASWGGTAYIVASAAADATAVGGSATTPVACVFRSSNSTHYCPISATAAGTGKFKVIDAATVALATATSNEVSVTSSSASAASVKISFNKATYAPGELGYILITPLDAAGKAVAASTVTNGLASGGITSTVGLNNAGAAITLTNSTITTAAYSGSTTVAGSEAIFFTAPVAGGTISLTAKGGSGLPVAGQVALSASATVTDNGAAALAAVTALATTVASLKTLITTLTNLVLKIQKKVKA